MPVTQEILKKKKELKALCDEHSVLRLYVFGSSVTENFKPESDLDFLVEMEKIPPVEKGEKLIHFWDKLEKLFARKVDLLTSNSIKNPYLYKSIKNSRILLYDRTSKKIFV